jgi:hypothetical protein
VREVSTVSVVTSIVIERFKGGPPTWWGNTGRVLALMGPKQPIDIVTIADDKVYTVEPPPKRNRFWCIHYLIEWIRSRYASD